MKYSEIIGLQEYFHPVFNIENETVNYWKQFIPNEQFYEVLRKTLSAIDTSWIIRSILTPLMGENIPKNGDNLVVI